jgi:PIN domain nuclease of toxin-antitoxin system
MTLLLDTHAFLRFWWADPQLSATATAAICDPANRKLISPASSWEIAITGSRIARTSTGTSAAGPHGFVQQAHKTYVKFACCPI